MQSLRFDKGRCHAGFGNSKLNEFVSTRTAFGDLSMTHPEVLGLLSTLDRRALHPLSVILTEKGAPVIIMRTEQIRSP
jgi:hypothetical protein